MFSKAFEQKVEKFTWASNPRFHLKLMIDPNQQALILLGPSSPLRLAVDD